jgi:hypothetical protein
MAMCMYNNDKCNWDSIMWKIHTSFAFELVEMLTLWIWMMNNKGPGVNLSSKCKNSAITKCKNPSEVDIFVNIHIQVLNDCFLLLCHFASSCE